MSVVSKSILSGHTVVIPLYNKAAWIGETIASLAAQTQPPDQLVIVDDASTDGSLQAARDALTAHIAALARCRVDLVTLPRNAGPGAARNAGLARAEGERISFLDADDRYRADALRTINDRMRTHRLALVVLGYDSVPEAERWPEPGTLDDELVAMESDTCLLKTPLHAAAHPAFVMGRASNVAAQRTLLEEHRYHTGARLNEGSDFWYRVLKSAVRKGERVGLITAPLIHYRILDDSLSHHCPANWRDLEIPPSLLRYADSDDPDDLCFAAMLARRWVDHARATVPDPAQRRDFFEHHRALLARWSMADAWGPP
ncbi:MAG: glycosyltransferase family 2 protein [Cyanobacteriota bacterium]|jgi:glycosyltransferase involved in cell wall biosynthesis